MIALQQVLAPELVLLRGVVSALVLLRVAVSVPEFAL